MSSIAKVHCSEAIFRVIDRAIQLCGGDGVTDSLPLVSYMNEVRPFRIYDGSNETHKWAISRRAASRRRKDVDAGAPQVRVLQVRTAGVPVPHLAEALHHPRVRERVSAVVHRQERALVQEHLHRAGARRDHGGAHCSASSSASAWRRAVSCSVS